jgi:hypothetical protein
VTDSNLSAHIERNVDWTPKNESLSSSLVGLDPDSFYEVCVAIIDQSTVYYVHRTNCREVRTLGEDNTMKKKAASYAAVTNITFVPDSHSITVAWKVSSNVSADVIRKISLRRFSQENVTQLYVLEDLNTTTNSPSGEVR